MDKRRFRTYFFHVGQDNGDSFKTALENVFEIPVEQRIYDGVRLLTLKEIQIDGKMCVCEDIERIYMDNLPSKTGQDIEPDDLSLDEDEGLGYNTAFIYYEDKGILALQSNNNGVSYSRFRDYINSIQHKNDNASGFYINPIIVSDDNAEKVLNNQVSPSFKSISFTIDNPESFDFVDSDEQASILKDIVKGGQNSNALKMVVTLSAGREKERFLDKLKIMTAIKRFLSEENTGRTKKLEARASLDGGENTDLNFLPNKLQYIDEINIERNQPSLEAREKAMTRAFLYHKEYIYSRG